MRASAFTTGMIRRARVLLAALLALFPLLQNSTRRELKRLRVERGQVPCRAERLEAWAEQALHATVRAVRADDGTSLCYEAPASGAQPRGQRRRQRRAAASAQRELTPPETWDALKRDWPSDARQAETMSLSAHARAPASGTSHPNGSRPARRRDSDRDESPSLCDSCFCVVRSGSVRSRRASPRPGSGCRARSCAGIRGWPPLDFRAKSAGLEPACFLTLWCGSQFPPERPDDHVRRALERHAERPLAVAL
jgi:hypothetical protein